MNICCRKATLLWFTAQACPSEAVSGPQILRRLTLMQHVACIFFLLTRSSTEME